MTESCSDDGPKEVPVDQRSAQPETTPQGEAVDRPSRKTHRSVARAVAASRPTLDSPSDRGPEGEPPLVQKSRESVRKRISKTATRQEQPELNREEEEILRKAQIYLLFTAKRPMFWNVAAIREEKGEGGARRWIIAVHLRAPSGHEGYLGDLLSDGERFTELTDVEVMRERVRQIAADTESPSPLA